MIDFDITQRPSKLFAAEIAKMKDKKRKAVQAALRPFDPDAEGEAWFERHAPMIQQKAPGPELSLIGFGVLFVPLASDMENVFVDVFVGGDKGYDPLTMEGLAYERYFPYPDVGELFSPMMTAAYRLLVEEEDGSVAQEEYARLHLIFAACCGATMCSRLPELIRGGSQGRYIIAGENEFAELIGAVTGEGWNPIRPGETTGDFARRIAG